LSPTPKMRDRNSECSNYAVDIISLPRRIVYRHSFGRSIRQEQIWTQAVALEKNDTESRSAAPMIQSLTDLITTHGERVMADMRSRIPLKLWSVLYGITIFSLVWPAPVDRLQPSHTPLCLRPWLS
jgi:hypothetical protein